MSFFLTPTALALLPLMTVPVPLKLRGALPHRRVGKAGDEGVQRVLDPLPFGIRPNASFAIPRAFDPKRKFPAGE